jgi:hypothetical protein
MKVGDLVMVRYHNKQEHLGIVVEIDDGDISSTTGELKVAWDDGDISWIFKRNVQVLDESR